MRKGYREMIRDRMPLVINLALTWCKAKGRWIDHVYEYIVKKYPKEKRSIAVKMVLGIKQQYKRQEIYDYFRYVRLMDVKKDQVNLIPKDDLFMPFKETINWQDLDDMMRAYWEAVNSWVVWFRTTYLSIESAYHYSLDFGNDEQTSKTIIMDKYNLSEKLANYLIKSF